MQHLLGALRPDDDDVVGAGAGVAVAAQADLARVELGVVDLEAVRHVRVGVDRRLRVLVGEGAG